MYHQRPLNDDADDHRILQGYEQNSGLQVVVDFSYFMGNRKSIVENQARSEHATFGAA